MKKIIIWALACFLLLMIFYRFALAVTPIWLDAIFIITGLIVLILIARDIQLKKNNNTIDESKEG